MHRTAILSLAWYLPRVQRRDPCRIVRRRCRPAAHHSRFTELPRSGRSVWRPEVDRASWEYRSSSSWAKRYVTRFRQRRGNGEERGGRNTASLTWSNSSYGEARSKKRGIGICFVQSQKQWAPSERIHRKYVRRRRRTHSVLIIVVVRTRDDDGTRNQRSARNADSEHRIPDRVDYYIERETKKKRVGHRSEWAKKRTQRWITRAECLSISSSAEFVRGEEISRRSERERDDYSGRPSKTSKSIYEAHYDFRVSRGRVPN